jgi:peptide/nickel transport system substrate-binding protein
MQTAMLRTLASLVCPAVRTTAAAALGLMLLTAPATAQAPDSGQPKAGGSVRIGDWSEPSTLNPYFSNGRPSQAFAELTFDGLARGAPDGSYMPILAAEIPTQANGDVSPDGTVVTWKLKPGVIWSDGQPFTSQDVLFTYQMLMDTANPVLNRSDYAAMDSVAAPDDHTVVVTYKQLYAPYRLAFPFVFPAHVFNSQTNIAHDPFNRAPNVTTGPFVFKSWSSGDTLTYDRNPNYREPGKPYLDEVIVRFTPDRDAEIQTLEAGDLDAAYFLDETYLPLLATLPDVSVDPVPGPTSGVQNLYVNTSCSSGPQQGDPKCPNLVLGDLHVRQAIELAIDKQAILHGLLADRVKVAGSVLPAGPYGVDVPPSEFNPDKAQLLLDQAGWVVGSDGVRSKNGVRAHLMLFNAAGATLSEEAAQLIQGNLRDVGIETETREVSVSLVGSIFSMGSFDLDLFGGVIGVDPQGFLYNHYSSDQVPNPELQSGNNWDRIQDPKLDQALALAGGTLDDTQRQAAYASFAELLRADEAVIPLYQALQVDARTNHVRGWQSNGNDNVTWNIQDWWLNQ